LIFLSFRNPPRIPKGGAVSDQYRRWLRSITSVAAWTTPAAKDALLGNGSPRRSLSSSPRSVADAADERRETDVDSAADDNDDADAVDARKAAATLERSSMMNRTRIK